VFKDEFGASFSTRDNKKAIDWKLY